MRGVGQSELGKELSESQRAALISLLGDDDQAVYEEIRARLISCGPIAATWLRPHRLSGDPALRRRAQELVNHFDRQTADDRFLFFCLKQGSDLDIEEGAWLLAGTKHPAINIEGYRALLDGFAAELRDRVPPGIKPQQLLSKINQYLFSELSFVGNESNYFDPDNSYLNRVLDRRTGNPISLSLLYILVAKRLKVPITGIGLPGHFICRHQSTSSETYIDPFNRGKFLTKADCIHYLARANYSLRDEYLTPANPRRMLLRICSNLHQIYMQLEQADECTRLQRYVVALAK